MNIGKTFALSALINGSVADEDGDGGGGIGGA